MTMLQMILGFQVSQAVYVVAKLGISAILAAKGPRTVEELAAEVNANADALGRVIRFLASLGLFRTNGAQVEVTDLGATLADGPGSLRHSAYYLTETQYTPFGDLLRTVQTGEPAATRVYGEPFFEWVAKDPARVEVQNRGFAWVTSMLREGMFDSYRLPEGAVVADIGGADGSMIARLLADDPDREGIVFDLPQVVAAAAKTIADNGLADRVQPVGGDFFESVPAADVYILSTILHDWDDESCRRILGNIARAARPGARLVIAESVVPPGDEPHPAKSVDLSMLVMLTGRERTEAEFRALLDSAGFTLDRIVACPPSPFCWIESTVR
jgi:predicted transcriptional regulator/SAM-dependent methyltransferase